MKTKNELQEEVLNLWKQKGFRGTLSWVTGIGKSITLKKACDKILEQKSNFIIDYIVPTKVLKQQALKILDERVNVYIINTYVKKKRECNVLILDEILSISI